MSELSENPAVTAIRAMPIAEIRSRIDEARKRNAIRATVKPFECCLDVDGPCAQCHAIDPDDD